MLAFTSGIQMGCATAAVHKVKYWYLNMTSETGPYCQGISPSSYINHQIKETQYMTSAEQVFIHDSPGLYKFFTLDLTDRQAHKNLYFHY